MSENQKKLEAALSKLQPEINELLEARKEAIEQLTEKASEMILTFKATINLESVPWTMDVDLVAAAVTEKIKDTRHVQGPDPNQPDLVEGEFGRGRKKAKVEPPPPDEEAKVDDDDPFGVKSVPDPAAQPPEPEPGDDPFGEAPAPLEVRNPKTNGEGKKSKAKRGQPA